MLGDRLGAMGWRDMSLLARKRVKISLWLLAIISPATGRPMRPAAQAANTLPKLPVGTAKLTARSGAPSASAALK